jgi:hypothetical protein
MARPGIMLYFDILEPIRVLPDADKGRLLVAMLEYGQSGTVPEFTGMLSLAWGFVKPKLDRDDESYESAIVQRQYAAFCKKRKVLNLPKIPFEEWLSMDYNERLRMATEGNEPLRAVDSVASRYPTTSTTGTTPTPTNTNTSTTAAAATTTNTTEDAAAADGIVKVVGGELGKNVVFLSDEQIADLLDQMDIETFDHYVDKLSSFIIKNDAKVKNHYETILKWWHEDSAVPKKTDKIPKGASGKLGQAELDNIQRLLSEAE